MRSGFHCSCYVVLQAVFEARQLYPSGSRELPCIEAHLTHIQYFHLDQCEHLNPRKASRRSWIQVSPVMERLFAICPVTLSLELLPGLA
jgi:hypothetical protein